MNKWISVKDKLPDLNQRVLIYVNSNLNSKFNSIEIGYPEDCQYEDIKIIWNHQDFCSWTDKEVTHWMPLPELPK